MLLYMYITLLYCSVPACAEFLFTLENTNIKSWLSAGQTLNHNNWYPYAILLIIWNSITKTRFFFFFFLCYPGTLGVPSEGLRALKPCYIPDLGLRVGSKLDIGVVIIKQILPVLNLCLSCAVREQLQQSSLRIWAKPNGFLTTIVCFVFFS